MLTGKVRVRALVMIVAGLTLAGIATGCSSGSGNSASSGVADGGKVAAPAAAPEQFNGGAAAPGDKVAPTTAPQLPATEVQRSIIYQGTMTVRVSDVDAAALRATAMATGSGGYVGGDQRSIDAQASVATLTLRVPAAQFNTTLAALSGLGKEQDRQVSTQDVTEKVVDVQSRIKTQQASVDRIRALLAQATSVAQIVSIEGELTQREADLESLEAQMRSLTDLTSLSTITVTLLGPEAKLTAKPAEHHKGFVAGLKSGWHTFVDSVTVLFQVIGALLPFLIAIGIPAWIIIALIRRRRRHRPAVEAAPTPEQS